MKWVLPIFLSAGLVLSAAEAAADPAKDIQDAAAAYHQGRISSAIQMLHNSLNTSVDPKDRWNIASVLIDVCTYSYDFRCIDDNWTAIIAAADKLKLPQVTGGRIVYLFAFRNFLAGNIDNIQKTLGKDFVLKDANPITDPELAVRFYILGAQIEQRLGHFNEAREYLNRAFAIQIGSLRWICGRATCLC